MRARHFLLAAGALLAGTCTAAAVDTLMLPHGVTFRSPDGWTYQVRPNSWVTRLTGSDATTIGPTIQLAWPRGGRRPPSSYLICHELRHLWQRRKSAENPDPTPTPAFELKHVLVPSFKDSVEEDASTFGMQHRNDPHCVFVARFLAERVVVK